MKYFSTVLGRSLVAFVLMVGGVSKRLRAEGQELARKPGYEVRVLSEGVPVCEVLGCEREATEYDGDRHIWLCERHTES
jgi:hypothetical protein